MNAECLGSNEMSAKKDIKINPKKGSVGSVPMNPRGPPKHSTKNTLHVSNSNGLKDENAITKIDCNNVNFVLAPNKPSPTKTSRNQVSANWNNVANTLKSQRTIAPSKKIGNFPLSSHHPAHSH